MAVAAAALTGFLLIHQTAVSRCRDLGSSASDRDLRAVASAAILADRRLASSGDLKQAIGDDPLAFRYMDALRSRVAQERDNLGEEKQHLQSFCGHVDASSAVVKAMVRIDNVDSSGQVLSASIERYEIRATHERSGWFVVKVANPSEFNPRGT